MALTGFDPQIVTQSINSVKSSYDNLIKALGDDMQQQFIGGMADKWACTQAQTFFNTAFKPAVDQLISNSNKIFESVVSAMNSAAQAWASATDSSFSPSPFSGISKTMDTSVIQENIGGVRGIDLNEALTVAGKLSTIVESAKSALSSAQSAVDQCGFMGGDQASNLINSLATIKNKIDDAAQSIATETKTAIDTTVQNYSNTEGKVSEAFAAN
ncbi:MAG: hypothetical protein PUB18_01080 [bacterium]|nr:hypothetical protein [bacterium]